MESLHVPLVLKAGESLAGRSFMLADDFVGAPSNAMIVVTGAGVSIRDVRLYGSASYQADATVGIRAQGAAGLTIERVSIDGMPQAGIFGFGCDDLVVRDVFLRHCFVGLNLTQQAPSHRVTVDRLTVMDTWGRDGGGDGMAMNQLRDSTVTDCIVTGTHYCGFKFTGAQHLMVSRCRGSTCMIQGLIGGTSGEPARDVLMEDCTFDKGLGRGLQTREMNCIQVSASVASLRVHRCILNGADQNGHGVQVATGSHVIAEDCVIRDFNGVRGTTPAHACDVVESAGSSINDNFALVNQFVDQQRILLKR